MSIDESGTTRSQQAVDVLDDGLLDKLSEQFQVRLYKMSGTLERMKSLTELSGSQQSTRIGDSLKQVVVEAGSLPIGAVLLLSDGADNSGGIDLNTISEIRGRRIPVHTMGFGREKFARDIEITNVQAPARALADSRLMAEVTLRQNGYAGDKARLTLRESGRVLASRDVTLAADGAIQTETVLFSAGIAGAKHLEITIDPLNGEENPNNNRVNRLVNVESKKPRVLYFEGELRWEYGFMRKALNHDRNVMLVSMVRTTENKFLFQGTADEKELTGFPSRVEELFAFDGLIIGTTEASYFSAPQQELIRQFVDRRGGGLLFLGGRKSLAEGGYRSSPLGNLLPVSVPGGQETFHRERATVALTSAGADSLLTRIEEDTDKNIKRWRDLPALADYQQSGAVKPGAVELARLTTPAGRDFPLLVTQSYGHGRTALFATGGSWRWQMSQPLEDMSHEIFWQQMLRWLVTGTPGQVSGSTPKPMLSDESRVELRAEVRDKTYAPMLDARVVANVIGPGGIAAQVELAPDPVDRGLYKAEWQADVPGSFMAEIVATRGAEEVGRDAVTFQREDGVAENFHAEQNRQLLEKLSAETGGQYYTPNDVSRLPEVISYSEAGITIREIKDLWNMPAIFLLLLLLKSAEWFLRRKWGVV